jgi:hypothetical protein
MKNFIVFFLIIGTAAFSISAQVFDKRHVSKDMLQFIESRNYTYSVMRSAIPTTVLKDINEHGNENFNVGDKADRDSGKAFQSCVDGGDFAGFLNFVLVNDSTCLLGYTIGGYALHSIILFVQYGREFKLAKYDSWGMGTVEDTASLKRFVLKKSKPDYVWTKPD